MRPSDRVPVAAGGIICRETDDGAVLVSPEAGDLRVLNQVGAAIWQLLDGRRDVAELEAERSGRGHLDHHRRPDEPQPDRSARGVARRPTRRPTESAAVF